MASVETTVKRVKRVVTETETGYIITLNEREAAALYAPLGEVRYTSIMDAGLEPLQQALPAESGGTYFESSFKKIGTDEDIEGQTIIVLTPKTEREV